jgi:hypothetical protein
MSEQIQGFHLSDSLVRALDRAHPDWRNCRLEKGGQYSIVLVGPEGKKKAISVVI